MASPHRLPPPPTLPLALILPGWSKRRQRNAWDQLGLPEPLALREKDGVDVGLLLGLQLMVWVCAVALRGHPRHLPLRKTPAPAT